MHRFLRAWRERGKDHQYQARVINYADDFVILSRGHAAEALAWTRWAMTHLGLTLNETKTCLRTASRDPFDFLGYTFGQDRYRKTGQTYLAAKPSRRSVQRLKRAVRAQLRPGNQGRWPEVRNRLNRTLRGWATYFSYGSRATAGRAVDNYVYGCVRGFLRRRHKVPTRGDPAFLGRAGVWPARGVPNATAAGRPSVVCLGVKPVGEPDAGNPHVRFDERRRETASWGGLRHRRSAKAAGNSDSSRLSRPRPSSTLPPCEERPNAASLGIIGGRKWVVILAWALRRPACSGSFASDAFF